MLVRVLGPLEVEGDDGPIEVPRRMERRLLTALAARRPAGLSVGELVDALWGDRPPTSARKTLQTNVLRLRRAIGDRVIATTSDGYRLGEHVRVDVEEFERADGDDLRWWRGEPFADLADWPPLEGRRARLVELHRRAEEVQAEALLTSGRAADAVAELERLVLDDPTREVRWTLLVRALLGADRRPDALRTFERARRTLATELGIAPGAELIAAHRSALADAPSTHDEDPIAAIDRLLAEGARASAGGEVRAATAIYVGAAGAARTAGDIRRFAVAALGAAGDGVRVALDDLSEVLSLVRDALDRVPPGPTATRSRLLARLAVLQSQHVNPAENEPPARTALAIARALDDPSLLAGALAAIAGAVPDPLRSIERRVWIDELLGLADTHPDEPWLHWAQPLDARERVLHGDIAGAIAVLADLEAAAAAAVDVVGVHAARYGRMLAATSAGDWPAARVAAGAIRQSATAALFDEATAVLGEFGMLAMVAMLSGKRPPPPLALDVEWPTPEMAATTEAFFAAAYAGHGQTEGALSLLDRLTDVLPQLARDGYWLATLSMVADAGWLTAHRRSAEVTSELLAPAVELTITDPGLLYRGAAAHFAGLTSSVLGRADGRDLLTAGLRWHERHGALWMVARSHLALNDLAPTSR